MACYEPPEISSVPIAKAVNHLRQIDRNRSAVQAARALGVSFGDCKADESPFAFRSDTEEVATATDIEVDADFTLDIAEAATEEALS